MMTMRRNFRRKQLRMGTFKCCNKIFLDSLVPYLKLRKDISFLIELVKRTLSRPSVLDVFYVILAFQI